MSGFGFYGGAISTLTMESDGDRAARLSGKKGLISFVVVERFTWYRKEDSGREVNQRAEVHCQSEPGQHESTLRWANEDRLNCT